MVFVGFFRGSPSGAVLEFSEYSLALALRVSFLVDLDFALRADERAKATGCGLTGAHFAHVCGARGGCPAPPGRRLVAHACSASACASR